MDSLTVSFGESTFSDGDVSCIIRHWTINVNVNKAYVVSDIPVSDSVGAHISSTGEVIDAYNPFMYNWRDEWYDDSMSEDFWTIDGIYRTMQKWKPLVAQLYAENESVYKDLAHLVTVTFALPDADDISENDAIEIASAAVKSELGISEDHCKLYDIRRAYYIKSNGNGVYFFWFQRTKDMLSLPVKEQEVLKRVAVHIDAETGEVITMTIGNYGIEDIL